MYYVSDSHHLSSSVAAGFGWPIQGLGKNFSTAVDTRSLSVTSVPGSRAYIRNTNSSGNLALLYYENSAGNVSALLQRFDPTKGGGGSVRWHDITSQSSQSLPGDFQNGPKNSTLNPTSHTLYESLSGFSFGTPFTSMANYSGGARPPDMSPGMLPLGAFFFAPSDATLVTDTYFIGLNGSGSYEGFSKHSASLYPMLFVFVLILGAVSSDVTDPSIHQSDMALFGTTKQIWINGTQPVTGLAAPPNVSFPFRRLASVYSADQLTTYLYHQINGTTLAEEQWDNLSQTWLSSQYITVSES